MCVFVFDEWTNERMAFLDDGGEGGSYSSKTDSKKKEIRGSLIFFWGKRFGRPEKNI